MALNLTSAVVGLSKSRKVVKNNDGFLQSRYRKIKIPSSGVLHCWLPRVYQQIWNPVVGKVAIAVKEEGNVHDSYAVTSQSGRGHLLYCETFTTQDFQGVLQYIIVILL